VLEICWNCLAWREVTNGAVCTTISVNVNRGKSMLIYHLSITVQDVRYMFRPSRGHHQAPLQELRLNSFIVQKCSITYFELQEAIIRRTYKNKILGSMPDDDLLKVRTCSGTPLHNKWKVIRYYRFVFVDVIVV
jgi:hypothetical protein